MDSIRIAQVVGVTSASFLAGSNALYSYNFIPTLCSAPASTKSEEKRLISEWRHMFHIGYSATQVQCLICTTSFAYLAYSARNSTLFSRLYTATAIIIPSTVPYTLTVQRALNAALNLRAEKLDGPGSGTQAEALGKGGKQPLEMEKGKTTEELVCQGTDHLGPHYLLS